jgi:hypothetical protein
VRLFLLAGLILLSVVCPNDMLAQAPSNMLSEPIAFYGGRLLGFDQRGILRTAKMDVRPTAPASVFMIIKLEIPEPFEYKRGRFREITLTDGQGGVYRYRGWLTEDGWMQIDEPNDQTSDVSTIQAGNYPAVVDLYFEVPESARSLVLHFGTSSASLVW